MEAAFFCYTVLMMLLFAAAAMMALSAYLVSRKRIWPYVSAFFAFYVCDLALIFQYEYFGLNITMTREVFFQIDLAYLKVLLSAGALQSLWMAERVLLDLRSWKSLVLPGLFYIVVQVLTLVAIPEGPLQQWAFYTERQLALLSGVIWAYVVSRRAGSEALRLRLDRYRPVLIAVVVLCCLVVVEDTANILILEPPLDGSPFPLYLSERNFFENVMALVVAFLTFRAAASDLKLRFKEPLSSNDSMLNEHVEEVLPEYAARFELTARERDILRLVLLGKSNPAIARDEQVALGTVKTHVHHILQKTGQETRQDLIRDFWRR